MSKRKLWALLTFIAFIMWQVLFLGTMFKVKKDVPKHVEIDWDEALPYRNRSQTRRLASPSNAIHCVQTPLYLDQESTFKLSTEVTEKKFAYVWYASSDVYLCSAMTALKITKDLRSQEKSSHLKVDFVLMLVESDFRKSNLTQLKKMIALKLAVTALLAIQAQGTSLRQDEGCTSQGGTCVNWQYYVCHGGVETGLCSGDSNIRCCLPCDAQCQTDEDQWSQGDAACAAEGGECKLNSNYCDGVYEDGLCGGPAERACCKAPNGDCPPIVSRAEWGARAPGSTTYMGNGVQYMFIHHSAGASCSSKSECIAEVKGIQNYHMDSNGWSDIGYSFLIGGDGNVYEGRGWNKVGAHTYGFNSVGYGIDFIGTFTSTNPTQAAQDAYKQLAECAAAGGYISSGYEVKGHRQTGSTECPGNTFYETIKSYPHWTNGNIGKDMTLDEETRIKYMEL